MERPVLRSLEEELFIESKEPTDDLTRDLLSALLSGSPHDDHMESSH